MKSLQPFVKYGIVLSVLLVEPLAKGISVLFSCF